MKWSEIEPTLKHYNIRVDVRPTLELFPHTEVDTSHYSVVCENEEDQQRVHHWIQFMTPMFRDFNAWAVFVMAIVEKQDASTS